MLEPEDLPPFLTICEAAEFVRIGRTKCYDLARQYLCTGGKSGLPCIRVGRQLRVPRRALLAWVATGTDQADPPSEPADPPASDAPDN